MWTALYDLGCEFFEPQDGCSLSTIWEAFFRTAIFQDGHIWAARPLSCGGALIAPKPAAPKPAEKAGLRA
jgi:hypothetical protein